jgi:hypothetical protein
MIEVLKQAIDYIENVPDDRDSVGHIDRHALVAALKERLAQPHETTLKEFNQLIHDDPKYHTWAKEKALQALHDENERLGLYKDAYAEQNFCSRCGKRTPDLITVHTCTPPREGT